jgi:hypothetical protein
LIYPFQNSNVSPWTRRWVLPDFRGPKGKPGSRGVYAGVPLHASHVCLHAVGGMDLDMQLELFALALDEFDRDRDPINQVIEVTFDGGDDIRILRYALPPS